MAGAAQKYHRSKQQSKNPDHFALTKNRSDRDRGHNRRDFASNEPVSAIDFQTVRLKNPTTYAKMAALPANPLTKRARND
jgi:hypothetical protein